MDVNKMAASHTAIGEPSTHDHYTSHQLNLGQTNNAPKWVLQNKQAAPVPFWHYIKCQHLIPQQVLTEKRK